MSTKRFKFVSPGVFLNEIDNSRVPRLLDAVGPTIIGRTEKGPGMIPLTVNSMTEFVEVFGNPIPGGRVDDAWRNGNYSTPQYAAYAAQAFLRNSGPVNVVRLLGTEDASAGPAGAAGWKLQGSSRGSETAIANGQASLPGTSESAVYGLYLFSTGGIDPRGGWKKDGAVNSNAAVTKGTLTGSLAAVWYMENSAIILSGNLAGLDDNRKLVGQQVNDLSFSMKIDAHGSLNVNDSYTIVTPNGSTITVNANANTTTSSGQNGDVTLTFDIGDGSNDATATNLATALNHHDELVAAAVGDTVTVSMVSEEDTNAPLGAVTITATAKNTAGSLTLAGLPGTVDSQAQGGVLTLTPTFPSTFAAVTGSNVLVQSVDASKMEFTAYLYDKGGDQDTVAQTAMKNERTSGITAGRKVVFNFDRDSDRYIRKVFNTNPTLTNTVTTQADSVEKYWLGETFDRFIKDIHGRGTDNKLHKGVLGAGTNDGLCAAIVPLHVQTFDDRTVPHQDSVTGWVISQDLTDNPTSYAPESMQKLFKFIGIADGGWNASNIKISIVDLKVGNDVDPYGKFTVLVRRVNDNDGRKTVLERFSECTLNPNSKNYIARKIGDQYREWDEADSRYRVYGEYANQSSLIRVKMHQDIDNGVLDPELLPFGFYGPPRYKTGKIETGNLRKDKGFFSGAKITEGTEEFVVEIDESISVAGLGFRAAGGQTAIQKFGIVGLPTNATASMLYPTLPLRISSSAEGLSNPKDACFGVSTYRSPTDTRFDPSYVDVVRRMGRNFVSTSESEPSANAEVSFYFSCDDLIAIHRTGSASTLGKFQPHLSASLIGSAVYASGSRRANVSNTAGRGGYRDLVKSGVCNFTMPMYGGFDGFDITEKDPLRNSAMSGDETTNYELATLKRAIDTVSDPEVIEMNALVAPGITNTRITNQMIRVCEDRADALAIIDIEKGGYISSCENTDTFKRRIQNSKPRDAIDALEARGLNSSYACAFYPWVKIVDQVADQQLWVPPSVAALGTFGSTESQSELWFAPAGFTRGGLSEGAAGVPVLAVSQRVTSKERDELYEANINPIAQFPAEGIVVFGQKTLQVTPSALDRINVRRLMIFVKKEISRIAARLLFEQNVQATWDRFRGQVEPFLDSVKSRFGLTEFKVVLDETTTTPDLIDRNIMYAKIFLKPARSIEFIAIDFVITNSGASFEE